MKTNHHQPYHTPHTRARADKVHAEGRRALVYCMTGVSRGPAVVVAHLMRLRRWRLAEAYRWVKDKRPSVSVSAADGRRLAELEVRLFGSCSAPLGLAALAPPGAFPTAAAQGQPQQHPQQQPQQQQQYDPQQQQQQQQQFSAAAPPSEFLSAVGFFGREGADAATALSCCDARVFDACALVSAALALALSANPARRALSVQPACL